MDNFIGKNKNNENVIQPTQSQEEKSKIPYVKLFTLFMWGCIFGVLMEGVFCFFAKGHWETPVVSIWGPFNILYGFDAVAFYVGAVKLKDHNIILRVVIMMIVATILELFCGLLLKKVLGMRAWNYSHNFMNYQGLICLKFSLDWGVAAWLFCLLCPKIDKLLSFGKGKAYKIICSVLTVFMIINVGLAGLSIIRWSKRHYGFDATTKIERKIDLLTPDEWMQKRFIEWEFLD